MNRCYAISKFKDNSSNDFLEECKNYKIRVSKFAILNEKKI